MAVLLIAGFTAVFITRSDEIGDLSLIYGGYFFALCLAAHLFLRSDSPTRTRTCFRSARCWRRSGSS